MGRDLSHRKFRESTWQENKPCLREKDSGPSIFPPLLHTKISLGGDEPTMFWDELKQRREAPELDDKSAWRNSPALFRFSVPQLWIMAGQCGFLVNITDCKIFPAADGTSARNSGEPVECPM